MVFFFTGLKFDYIGVLVCQSAMLVLNCELRQANEILRNASAYFAMAELDRPFKR